LPVKAFRAIKIERETNVQQFKIGVDIMSNVSANRLALATLSRAERATRADWIGAINTKDSHETIVAAKPVLSFAHAKLAFVAVSAAMVLGFSTGMAIASIGSKTSYSLHVEYAQNDYIADYDMSIEDCRSAANNITLIQTENGTIVPVTFDMKRECIAQ
jgi:hypothetical protein